ncbi:MAG: CDP-alcohol phosphatidyltransferase family protein [Kiritimatiellae bacterium]|nr:CDP-alcohol phosphatidyltransferase family protein [Kiritimatiellia bacterium]MDW8459487.1 CDP-alcohol phosphatidyltransferase family protein [Verrucomicrobiota bacterium]
MARLPKIRGLTLATRVTLLRILGIPAFAVLVIYHLVALEQGAEDSPYRWWALVVFAIVAGTDALDGYLARSRNEVSPLGRLLDPLADKALLLSALVLLTRPDLEPLTPHIPVWYTGLVISRDVLAVGGYFLVRHLAGAVHVQPRWTGKVATVLQMVIVLWVLSQAPADYFSIGVAAAAFFTTLAGVQYLIDGLRQIETAHRG